MGVHAEWRGRELIVDPDELAAAITESSPTPPTAIPATPGYTLDTTTYDNTVKGSGKLAVAVYPADTSVIAIALEGDDFPRVIINADPGDYTAIALGNGTVDPATGGVQIGLANDTGNPTDLDLVLNTPTGRRVVIGSNLAISADLVLAAIPTSDPHISNHVWNNAGTLKISAG